MKETQGVFFFLYFSTKLNVNNLRYKTSLKDTRPSQLVIIKNERKEQIDQYSGFFYKSWKVKYDHPY